MSEELKACPFCGGKPYTFNNGEVGCENASSIQCEVRFLAMDIEKWNTRPVEDALRKELEEAKKQLKLCMTLAFKETCRQPNYDLRNTVLWDGWCEVLGEEYLKEGGSK